MMLEPCLDILPQPQKALWNELVETPGQFVLYGGTAIALRLGHRESIDFDFFSKQPFEPQELYKSINYLENSEIIQQEENTLSCLVDRDGVVKVSYFGGLGIDNVNEAEITTDKVIKVASLLDLAGTKVSVVQQRAEKKDYIDIHAIITSNNGIGIEEALLAAKKIYGTSFNPQITLKALCFYGEGDLDELPDKVKRELSEAVKSVDISKIMSA